MSGGASGISRNHIGSPLYILLSQGIMRNHLDSSHLVGILILPTERYIESTYFVYNGDESIAKNAVAKTRFLSKV